MKTRVGNSDTEQSTMPGRNATESISLVIDRLSDALEQARGLPEWEVVLVVVLALLSFVVLMHLVALALLGPCVWMLYKRMGQSSEKERVSCTEDEPETDLNEDE